jgi:hypothetical protein
MNDFDSSPFKNVKIMVRIRNHPGEKDNREEIPEQSVKVDRLSCKSPMNRESVSREKSRSKSPSNASIQF